MRVLIIGGTGFIGSRITERCVNAGHTVAVFHRGRTPAPSRRMVHEFLDADSALPIVRFPQEVIEFGADVVIHTMMMGEADAEAAMKAFRGCAGRMVMLSSGDVYRAYGRFTGIEEGPTVEGLLGEDAPLRTVMYPYRAKAASSEALEYWYEKILAERAVMGDAALPGTVLRLPKVYGRGGDSDLATVYGFREHPEWRWTHGYVENVAAAVALAATDTRAAGGIYNVGEERTPTMGQRLERMPPGSDAMVQQSSGFNFAHDIAYDTSRIRQELGYRDVMPEQEALLRTATRAAH